MTSLAIAPYSQRTEPSLALSIKESEEIGEVYSRPSALNQQVKEMGLRVLSQFAFSLVFISMTAFFVQSVSVIVSMAALAVVSALVMAVVESILLFSQAAKNPKSPWNFLGHWISAVGFATVDSYTRDTLIHEQGHSLAANLFFKEANPEVTIGFGWGSCSFLGSSRYLTGLGRFFGFDRSLALISAAGPLAATLSSCTLIAASHALPEDHPRLKCYLNAMALHSVSRHAFYAISALWSAGQVGHDFVVMHALAGIHPLVSVCFLIAVPLLVKIVACQIKPDRELAYFLKG